MNWQTEFSHPISQKQRSIKQRVWRLPVVAAWVSERVCFQSLGSFPRELSREIACLLSSTYEAASVDRAQRRPHREREDRKTQGFVVGQAQLCSPPGPG